VGCVSIDVTNVADAGSAARHLYGLPAGDFVAARDQLVRTLRAAGQRDLAAEVKALRRPAVVAAELNRVIREAPDDLERLLSAAAELRGGHSRLVGGEPIDLARLQAAHRAVAGELAERTGRYREAVATILERASLDESQTDQLREGSFDREPESAIGFDVLGSFALRPAGPADASPSPAAGPEAVSTANDRAAGGPTAPERAAGSGPGAVDADQATEAFEPVAATTAAAPVEPEASEGPDREAIEVALERAGSVYDEAVHAQALARRRLEAAIEMEERAGGRVQELEQRLVEARRHCDDSSARREQAGQAAERAAAAVTRAGAERDRLSGELALVSDDPAPSKEG
jgi:hypothetical protein